MSKIEPTKWAAVEEHIKKGDTKLVVVCFVHLWNPVANHTLKSLTTIQKEVQFAKIFVVNCDEELEKCWELKITSSPTIYLYHDKKPLLFRRPDWEDQYCYIGSVNESNWLELIRFAKDTADKGKNVLYVDF